MLVLQISTALHLLLCFLATAEIVLTVAALCLHKHENGMASIKAKVFFQAFVSVKSYFFCSFLVHHKNVFSTLVYVTSHTALCWFVNS